MAPADIDLVLSAIDGVSKRIDALRNDVFSTLDRHDKRIRDLEMAEAATTAVEKFQSAANAQRRLDRRAIYGLTATTIMAAAGGLVTMLRAIGVLHF